MNKDMSLTYWENAVSKNDKAYWRVMPFCNDAIPKFAQSMLLILFLRVYRVEQGREYKPRTPINKFCITVSGRNVNKANAAADAEFVYIPPKDCRTIWFTFQSSP